MRSGWCTLQQLLHAVTGHTTMLEYQHLGLLEALLKYLIPQSVIRAVWSHFGSVKCYYRLYLLGTGAG